MDSNQSRQKYTPFPTPAPHGHISSRLQCASHFPNKCWRLGNLDRNIKIVLKIQLKMSSTGSRPFCYMWNSGGTNKIDSDFFCVKYAYIHKISSGTCHLRAHWSDRYPGTLSPFQVTETHLEIGCQSISLSVSTYQIWFMRSHLNLLAGHRYTSSNFSHQGDIPHQDIRDIKRDSAELTCTVTNVPFSDTHALSAAAHVTVDGVKA